MTVTPIRTRARGNRHDVDPPDPRIQQLTDMLEDPRYAGYTVELQSARDELLKLTAQHILAA